ncbi:hypothetical protein D3C83_307270 [compost metagenome]
MGVRCVDAPEIGAVRQTDARDEEGHRRPRGRLRRFADREIGTCHEAKHATGSR